MQQQTKIRRNLCYRPLLACALLALFLIGNAQGQTTQFTYQGKLNDNGNPASGQYDFQFKLFDTATVGTGTQQGSTIDVPNVSVTAGIFTVQLDFGAAVFPGAQRFLEISVRPAGGGGFTMLAPRQAVTATPYALRSITAGAADTAMNATQLAGLTASGFIQNTTTPQAATDFNIEGTGTANIFNAATQYSIGGNRVLSVSGGVPPNSNIFAGVGAGNANMTGFQNSFFGSNAGLSNTTASGNAFFGSEAGRTTTTGGGNAFFGFSSGTNNLTGVGNSFVGSLAGFNNTTGSENSFFGRSTGVFNTLGSANSFFGTDSGYFNTSGIQNAFFGSAAGFRNTTASQNSFFGSNAGNANTTGENNVFSGYFAGTNNQTGSNNTIMGAFANVGADNLSYATAIGAGAVVNTSNTVVLGRGADTVQIPGTLSATGTLVASIINATTQFNLSGNRVLFVSGDQQSPNSNIFAGVGAGANNTTPGVSNSFFGRDTGNSNTIGSFNSFFGDSAGFRNTSTFNSFFGAFSGTANTTGNSNSFFGFDAGRQNLNGNTNSFFGRGAGYNNGTGSSNSFVGSFAGVANRTGSLNSFLGYSAGKNNDAGNGNTFIGEFSGFDATNTTGHNNTLLGKDTSLPPGVSNATAIGFSARVTQSNSLVLGNGVNVGIGTTSPKARLHIAVNGGNIVIGDGGCGPGSVGINFEADLLNCNNYVMRGGDGNTYINRFTGRNIIFREGNGPNQVEIRPGGFVGIAALDTAGSTSLCRNGVAAIATCSSSLRYKTEIKPFYRGLDLINRLRPITFSWKQDGKRDVGFGAEEVAAVEPLLITHNEKGEIEGVKYDRITVALVNAVREQQAQIAKQKQQIDGLKRLVCIDHPKASICNSN